MRRLAVLVILVATSRVARADLAGAFYDDVRDVIEDLIQTEVTTSVVATIEQKSPALAFYMHGTLERLGSPYWGSLSRVLKDDLTVTVADFVYWHLSTGGGDGDIVASAKRFFGCVGRPGSAATDDGCRRLIAAVHDQHRPLLEVECRRQKPPPERRVACDIGLATKAALERRGAVRHHIVDALADIVLAEVSDRELADRLRDVLAKWVDLPNDLPTALLASLGNPDLAGQLTDEAIDKTCADPATLAGLFRDPSASRAWICFAISHKDLPAALAAKVTIADHGHTLDANVDFWVIEAALKDFDADRATDDSSFRLLADQVFDAHCPAGDTASHQAWPCTGARLGPGATVTVAWLGRELTGSVDRTGEIDGKASHSSMRATLLRFRKAIHRIEELRALVPPSLAGQLFYAGAPSPTARQVLRSVARMSRLVLELRARWYLWTQDKSTIENLDVAELLRVARNALGSDTKVLAFLDQHGSGGASSLDVGDWLRMVMRGDYRSLAMESLRSALDVHLGETGHPREKFFLTLAAYLLDSNEGVGETVARSAFRAAAKDLLLSQSHVGVPRAGDRLRLRWLPRLAMKLSFNDTYAVTDGDSRRTVVSADWPTIMFAFTDYAGVEVSFVDFVAPLAEMALRPAGSYHGYEYVALDALRPRFGAWVAVPQLSRRLALTAGFGARFLDVKRDTSIMTIDATYGAKASLTFDAGVEFVF
ncbi:MAG: hypothetical protein ACM31C_09465 [Acidobacteriota bacterium]